MSSQINTSSSGGNRKMTVNKFSEYVMDVHDLYNLADKNGFYLP